MIQDDDEDDQDDHDHDDEDDEADHDDDEFSHLDVDQLSGLLPARPRPP